MRLSLAIGNYQQAQADAKARMLAGKANPTANRREGSGHSGEALAHVAAATGVPFRTLQRAAFVEKHAIPEVRQSQILSVSEAEEKSRTF